MNRKRKFIFALIIGFFTFSIFVAIINSIIDVRNIYRFNQEETHKFMVNFVKKLRTLEAPLARNGTVIRKDFGLYRQFKYALAKEVTGNCYILGSSHIMMIDQSNFPWIKNQCKEAINLGVDTGTFEDIVLFLGALQVKPAPKTIFIELSPWVFRRYVHSRFTVLYNEYLNARAVFDLPGGQSFLYKNGIEKFGSRFNLQYLAYNITEVGKNRNMNVLTETKEIPMNILANKNIKKIDDMHERMVIFPSGRRQASWNLLSRERNIEIINGKAFRVSMPAIDSFAKFELKRVLSKMIESGNRIHFLMTPYHPKIWKCRDINVCLAFEVVEKEIFALADKLGIITVGAFNPEIINVEHRDFSDAHHVGSSMIWKLGNRIRLPSKNINTAPSAAERP